MITRRKFLTGASAVTALVVGASVGTFAGNLSASPARAAVYRGRGAGSCDGCSEAVARLLGSSPTAFDVEFIGPGESRQVTPETLSEMLIYAQPGGGDVAAAWPHIRADADHIRSYVDNGGNYIGICLGAYLAGSNPGFNLFPGEVYRYIDSPDAEVSSADYTTVETDWGGQRQEMYFQDGAAFALASKAPATVLATYPGGEPAAVIASFGRGRVGLIGPHPEADRGWFDSSVPDPSAAIHPELGHRLIEQTIYL
ncbi:BPL-N domain-containing protein [Mycobacterium sp. URHB0021]